MRVVATDPPAEATLGRFEPFFVRIQFDADEPVSLWARPYRNGKPVDRGARTNPSAKHTGSGYALGWVEFNEATEIDGDTSRFDPLCQRRLCFILRINPSFPS